MLVSFLKLLVTSDTGFENVLAEELRELANASIAHMSSGRVFLDVDEYGLANVFRSRIANNIYYVILVREDVYTLDDIYRVVKDVDFTSFIEPSQSFAVRSERIGEHSFTSIDIGRVAGQAVIDSYMQAKFTRLKVNLDEPDVEIYVELNKTRLVVAVSLTRESLHMRRYRVFNHPAALKSTIASAMLRIAGWKPGNGLYDPMCGGGTIVIEAALWTKGIEIPCIAKRSLDLGMIGKLAPQAISKLEKLCSRIPVEWERVHIGVDINPRFVEGAVINAKNAGVDDSTLFIVGDLVDVTPKIKSMEHEFGKEIDVAVFNPPYGYRMKPGGVAKLYRRTLEVLKESGFKEIVFITSAIRVTENVLAEIKNISVERLKVIHGTLPSIVYKVKF